MSEKQISASGEANVAILTEGSWQRKQADAKAKGWRDLREKGKRDGGFDVKTLCPREIRGGESTPVAAAVVEHDWKYARKTQLANLGRQIISEAYFLGTLSDDLPRAIANAIQGRELTEEQENATALAEQRLAADVDVSMKQSELNDLYTQFEKRVGGSNKVLGAMKKFAGSDEATRKRYFQRGKPEDVPLPYAVRNAIYHHNPNNTWSSGELSAAIELLRKWV